MRAARGEAPVFAAPICREAKVGRLCSMHAFTLVSKRHCFQVSSAGKTSPVQRSSKLLLVQELEYQEDKLSAKRRHV